MGRPTEYDREKVLTRATELFWKRGYTHTSVAQLLKAMKLGEGSFYNAFKSKRQLYLECLRHYDATFMVRRSEALRSELPAKARIEEFFRVVIDDFGRHGAPGCLVSNSLSNEVLSQRPLKAHLFKGFDAFQNYLAAIVADGQARGELAEDIDPEVAARLLFTYLHGLHRLSVYRLDRDARRAETRAFIEAVLPEA